MSDEEGKSGKTGLGVTHVRGVRGERRNKEGGTERKMAVQGEEMIVDLEKGQHRYAGRLLL